MSQAELLKRAIQKAGSARALAQKLDRPDSHISMWKHGNQAMPDNALAELAVYLGEDPIKALAKARGGAWKRIAEAMREKISQGFDWLLSHANPRRDLLTAG